MNDPHVVLSCCSTASITARQSTTARQKRSRTRNPNSMCGSHDDEAEFKMKVHCATVEEAKGMVEPYIRDWEFETSLERGRNSFNLRFVRPHIVDRNPEPDAISVAAHVQLGPRRYSRPYPSRTSLRGLSARRPYPC